MIVVVVVMMRKAKGAYEENGRKLCKKEKQVEEEKGR